MGEDPVAEDPAGIDALLARAVKRGLIDDDLATALRALGADEPPPVVAKAPHSPDGPNAGLIAESRRRRAQRRDDQQRRREAEETRLRAERDGRAAAESARREVRARERAHAIGAVAALRGDGGGWLDVAGADRRGGEEAAPGHEILPLIYENVGWFVGALLVLAGSIYGLREAWISFDAAGRWASVGGALLAYHALFVMVSAVLARRSALAGQFLAGIGACLVPLAYVAVANLSAQRLLPGIAAAAILTGACVVTLAGVGRRFGAGRALLPALLLPALTLLLYPHLGASSPARFALPILALIGPFIVTRRDQTRSSVGAFILALFVALASEVFALSSDASHATGAARGAGDGVAAAAVRFHTGGAGFGAWLGGYVTALGLTLFAVKAMAPSSEARRRALSVVVWVGFALTVGAGALGALAALGTGGGAAPAPAALVAPDRWALLAALAAVLAAAAQARLLAARWRDAYYLVLVLGSLGAAVAGRVIVPDADARLAWAAAALLPVALHLGGVRLARLAALPRFATEVAAAEAAILVLILWACEPARGGAYPITLIAGLALAVGCHSQASQAAQTAQGAQAAQGPRWHYLGAAAAALAIGLALAPARGGDLAGYEYVALATLYALYAIGAPTKQNAARPAAKLSPLDDASLALYLIAALAALAPLSFAPEFVWQAETGLHRDSASLRSALPLLAASAGLLLRAVRDRSALPSTVGALGAAVAAVAATGPRSAGAQSLTIGLLALAAAAIAALATPRMRVTVLGRACFGARELPWAWSGRGAIAQGFGQATFPLALIAVLGNVAWFGQRAIDRPLAIAGAVTLALACALLFATRAATTAGIRGRAPVLWALALAVAIAASTNRIDRPLPPAVVARNLGLLGVGLWVLARGVARAADWLEDRLDAPAGEGRRYHLVPMAGAAALAVLLVADACALAPLPLYRGLSVVPPLMMLGPALLALLLGRSARAPISFWIAAPLLAAGATLTGAQHAILGPALARFAGGAAWIPAAGAAFPGSLPGASPDGWQSVVRYGSSRALLHLYGGGLVGLAGAAVVFAALATTLERGGRAAGRRIARLLWTEAERDPRPTVRLAGAAGGAAAGIVLLVGLLGFWLTSLGASLLALATGTALAARRGWGFRFVPVLAAAALTVHAVAQLAPTVGSWPGAGLGALAVLSALAAHATLAEVDRRERHLARAHAVGAVLIVLAVLYGFGAGAPTIALPGGWNLIGEALWRLTTWGRSPVPAIALGLGSVAAVIAALSWNAIVRGRETTGAIATGAALATLALATLAVAQTQTPGAQGLVWLAASAAAVALVLTLVLTLVPRAAGVRLGDGLDDVMKGARLTRDGLMMVAGGLLAASLPLVSGPPAPLTAPAALVTLAILFGVSLSALVVERRPRQVYFLGVATTGGYGFLRATGIILLEPADDAVALLALDFALVGLTVLARRRGLHAIATATGRFAAAVPIAIGLLLPWQASADNALFAMAAAGFYGLLGWVERNRWLGAFGGVAANLALLVLSLSQGLGGFDIYLAPLGLCTLVVVHLYEDNLTAEAHGALRLVGTGLTYAPAALALVLQIGNARSDLYPFGFAAACLVGIVAGMWFHIRAYLVLGLAFLLLDLGTQLVRASLRSQRLGFFVLSLAGLLILSGMVAYTMNRDTVRAGLSRLRTALATWR